MSSPSFCSARSSHVAPKSRDRASIATRSARPAAGAAARWSRRYRPNSESQRARCRREVVTVGKFRNRIIVTTMERIDVAVIGGGVIGLASARAIAAQGLSTCVLERHPRPGLDTSTHNSGVIHAGIYYPAGTLKARLCVEGRHQLYAFCERQR